MTRGTAMQNRLWNHMAYYKRKGTHPRPCRVCSHYCALCPVIIHDPYLVLCTYHRRAA